MGYRLTQVDVDFTPSEVSEIAQEMDAVYRTTGVDDQLAGVLTRLLEIIRATVAEGKGISALAD